MNTVGRLPTLVLLLAGAFTVLGVTSLDESSSLHECAANSNLTLSNCSCLSTNASDPSCCDPCDTMVCSDNSTCLSSNETCTAFCQCDNATYLNDTCYNVCDTKPCTNARCNTTDFVTPICECDHGFYHINETYCQNYCDPEPCLNGGLCIAEAQNFTCNCTAGFTGALCDTDIDECELGEKPPNCPPGSLYSCINSYGSYFCTCPHGYIETSTGCVIAQSSFQLNVTFTDLEFSTNLSDPTSEDYRSLAANISDSMESLLCSMTSNNDSKMSVQVLEFSSGSVIAHTLIMHDGQELNVTKVQELMQSHADQCSDDCFGVIGSNASASDLTALAACDLNHCPSMTTCKPSHDVNENLYFWCQCVEGFKAVATELNAGGIEEICRDLNECDANEEICGPTGKCINTIGSYTCECSDGQIFNGKTCVKNTVCDSNPCNHGTCEADGNKFRCHCSTLYRGSLCDDSLPLILMIVACVLAVLVIILVICLLICWKRSQKKHRNSQYRPDSWMYLEERVNGASDPTEINDFGDQAAYSPTRLRPRPATTGPVRPVSGQFSLNSDVRSPHC